MVDAVGAELFVALRFYLMRSRACRRAMRLIRITSQWKASWSKRVTRWKSVAVVVDVEEADVLLELIELNVEDVVGGACGGGA